MPTKSRNLKPAERPFVLCRAKASPALGSRSVAYIRSAADLRQYIDRANNDSFWISFDRELTKALLRRVAWPTASLGRAILAHPVPAATMPCLENCFFRVVYPTKESLLPIDDLEEVLAAENRADLFIGGMVDDRGGTLTLWRGDLKSLTVPFSAFARSADGTRPDFARFAVTDCGQTVRLGDYEAATDAILYESDSDYRRRMNRLRRQSERTFGAALRRLRLQKGLKQDDFAPHVAAKTIARIEQGKVKKVQERTMAAIAKRLNVRPEEIGSY